MDYKTSDFKKGERVIYIPSDAKGDPKHPDCESGVVSSTTEELVFVKYDMPDNIMVTGDEDYTSKSTRPEDLRKEVVEMKGFKAWLGRLFKKQKYIMKALSDLSGKLKT